MRSGTGQICVNRSDAFTFTEAAGDPAANCRGILIPVAHDFMPDGPGKFTYTMDWDGYGSFVPLGARRPAEEQRGQLRRLRLRRQFTERPIPQSTRAVDEGCQHQASCHRGHRGFEYSEGPRGPARMGARGHSVRTSRHRGPASKRTRPARASPRSDFAGSACLEVQRAARARKGLLGGSEVGDHHAHVYVPDSRSADSDTARYYTQITDDVTASLPDGWSEDPEAPFTVIYQARAIGQPAERTARFGLSIADGAYELHFQLIARRPWARRRPSRRTTIRLARVASSRRQRRTNLLGAFIKPPEIARIDPRGSQLWVAVRSRSAPRCAGAEAPASRTAAWARHVR